MLHILILILYLLLPAFLLVQVYRDRSISFFRWVLKASLCTFYSLYLFLIGFWPMTFSLWTSYLLLLATVLVVIKSFFNLKRSIFFQSISKKTLLICGIQTIALFIFGANIIFALEGRSCSQDAISLEFPFSEASTFAIIQGGSHCIINHHSSVDAQRFALDIVKINRLGLRAKIRPKQLMDYEVFSTAVSSPCNGKVIEVVHTLNDLNPPNADPQNPAGNYLAIQIDGLDDCVVILAHLQKGSFLVQKNESVKVGQPLAQVGNSGNTSEPHLHIHCVQNSKGDFLFSGKGIPMKFDKRFLTRNDCYRPTRHKN